MDGKTLKLRIQKIEPSMAEVARKLEILPQSLNQTLNAADIKTGFIEQLVAVFDRPVSYFFGEDIKIDDHSHHDDHSAWFGSHTEHYENCSNDELKSKLEIADTQTYSLKQQLQTKNETIEALKADIASKQNMIDFLISKK